MAPRVDDRRVVAIARRWAKRSSRRTTVKAGTAAIVSSLTAAFGGSRAQECRKVGAGCDRDRDCCDGAQCWDGNCRCRDGFNNCDGRCRDLQRDSDDFGQCDNRCADGEGCQGGRCRDRQAIERDRCRVDCLRDCARLDPANCPIRCFNQCR